MSQLFRFELDALAESSRRISFDALLGQRLGVQIQLPHSPVRVFWGICSRITQGARNTGFTRFELDLVPHLRLLTRRGGFRIFQDVSVQQALEQSLAGQRASFELRASYEPHEMLVQYRETDFAYVSRLMEDEGIFYFFRHAADGDELVLADGPQSYSDADDFERPWSNLEGQRTIQESVRLGSVEHRLALAANASLELYDYPGSYGQPFDSVEKARRAAVIRMQEQAAASVVVTGASTVALAAGHTFTLEQHPDGNGKYLVTGVQHTAELPDLNNSMVSYRNDFTCIPADLVYRPPRTTPRPVVGGMQTAIVIAPLAGPIIDKLGRVKVKFHWDREGTSTTWLRVAQPYSGGPDGLWLPDVNDEVLVGFEHGDPHRPYVIPRLWNPDDAPPERRSIEFEDLTRPWPS